MSEFQEANVIVRDLEEEMKESYLRYSLSVIISRALPDVRDGLKPSQRRILYAMRQLRLSHQGRYRKCAKICGDTSGDYHPHGETVIYPTLVRMAQGWVMRYPLVNGQGNFGSIDGDPPAHMRYTEAKLMIASEKMMEDLDKETINFAPNYDETLVEPLVFPSKFPNLLCNGSSGIAVGMATNIPPHNLRELAAVVNAILDDENISVDDILQIMPGPDFPTGGLICGYNGIKEAFTTGRGKVIVRGRVDIEEISEKSEKFKIIITEIPYGVNKSVLISQIADLINKKEITSIADLRDDSDKDGLRIYVELKKGEIPDVTLNQLYKFTDLQVTFGCNMLALDNGLPQVMNIKKMICLWIDHRIDVIRRRTQFDLGKALDRKHIVEGYLKAISILSNVIKTIRESASKEDAKNALKNNFQFSERQSQAILDLRLYQLTGLEFERLREEFDMLTKKIEDLKAILGDEILIKNIIREELSEIAQKLGDDRKTEIIPAEGEMNIEDLIANEQVVITVSDDDYVKRMSLELFREQRRGGCGVSGFQMKKDDDAIKGFYVASTHDYLLVLTNHGRCYWLKTWQIPESSRRSKGRPLINLLEDIRSDETIATIIKVESFDLEKAFLVLATKMGTIKKTPLSAFENPRRKGIYAISIDDGDELVTARISYDGKEIMLFSHNGMAVRFNESDVRAMGRTARGVRGIRLNDGDFVINCEVVNSDDKIFVACENGFGKKSLVEDFRKSFRGGKGVRSIITSERNGNVVGALSINEEDSLLIISKDGQTIRFNSNELRIIGRSTQGVKLANIKDSDKLLKIQKIENCN